MDEHQAAFMTVLKCAGDIRQCLDKEEMFKTLDPHTQAYATLTKVYVEAYQERAGARLAKTKPSRRHKGFLRAVTGFPRGRGRGGLSQAPHGAGRFQI